MTKQGEYQNRRRDQNRAKVRAIRETGRCVDCGSTTQLEFDHLPGQPKFMDVSTLVSKRYSWPRIEREIAKCVLRCRPCHMTVSIERGQCGTRREVAYR